MAAACSVKFIVELTGLGENEVFAESFTTGVPARSLKHYAVIDAADTAQALILGDVATEELLVIKAVSGDIEVDLDCADVASFDVDLTIPEGKSAIIPQPASTVYWKGDGATDAIEYLLIGTA